MSWGLNDPVVAAERPLRGGDWGQGDPIINGPVGKTWGQNDPVIDVASPVDDSADRVEAYRQHIRQTPQGLQNIKMGLSQAKLGWLGFKARYIDDDEETAQRYARKSGEIEQAAELESGGSLLQYGLRGGPQSSVTLAASLGASGAAAVAGASAPVVAGVGLGAALLSQAPVTFNQAIDEAREAGLSGNGQKAYAAGMAGFEAGITAAFSFAGRAGLEAIRGPVKKAGTEAVLASLKTIKGIGQRVGKPLLDEFLEEESIDLVSIAWATGMSVDTTTLDPKDVTGSAQRVFERAQRVFVTTAMLGAVVTPGKVAFESHAQNRIDNFVANPSRTNFNKLPKALRKMWAGDPNNDTQRALMAENLKSAERIRTEVEAVDADTKKNPEHNRQHDDEESTGDFRVEDVVTSQNGEEFVIKEVLADGTFLVEEVSPPEAPRKAAPVAAPVAQKLPDLNTRQTEVLAESEARGSRRYVPGESPVEIGDLVHTEDGEVRVIGQTDKGVKVQMAQGVLIPGWDNDKKERIAIIEKLDFTKKLSGPQRGDALVAFNELHGLKTYIKYGDAVLDKIKIIEKNVYDYQVGTEDSAWLPEIIEAWKKAIKKANSYDRGYEEVSFSEILSWKPDTYGRSSILGKEVSYIPYVPGMRIEFGQMIKTKDGKYYSSVKDQGNSGEAVVAVPVDITGKGPNKTAAALYEYINFDVVDIDEYMSEGELTKISVFDIAGVGSIFSDDSDAEEAIPPVENGKPVRVTRYSSWKTDPSQADTLPAGMYFMRLPVERPTAYSDPSLVSGQLTGGVGGHVPFAATAIPQNVLDVTEAPRRSGSSGKDALRLVATDQQMKTWEKASDEEKLAFLKKTFPGPNYSSLVRSEGLILDEAYAAQLAKSKGYDSIANDTELVVLDSRILEEEFHRPDDPGVDFPREPMGGPGGATQIEDIQPTRVLDYGEVEGLTEEQIRKEASRVRPRRPRNTQFVMSAHEFENRKRPNRQETLRPEDRLPTVLPLQPGESLADFNKRLATQRGISTMEATRMAIGILGKANVRLAKIVGDKPGEKTAGRVGDNLKNMKDLGMEIDYETAQNPELFAQVVLHEIGHLTKLMKKLQVPIEDGSLADMAMKLGQAVDLVGSGKLTQQMQNELLAVSKLLKPFDEAADAEYTKYRKSQDELLADAVSMLALYPEAARVEMPAFHAEFLKQLDANPKLKQSYLAMQQVVLGTPAEIAARRAAVISQMYDDAETQLRIARADAQARAQSLVEPIWDQALALIYSKMTPGMKLAAGIEEAGMPEDAKRTRHYLNKMFTRGNAGHSFFKETETKVFQILHEQGIDENTIGNYADSMMAAFGQGKDKISGPMDQKIALGQLEHIKRTLGQEKFNLLEAKMVEYHKLVTRAFLQREDTAHLFTSEQKQTILNNRDFYVTQAIVDRMEDDHIKHGIYERKGTLLDHANPVHATNEKVLTMLAFAEINMVKVTTVQALDFMQAQPGIKAGEFIRYIKTMEFTPSKTDKETGEVTAWRQKTPSPNLKRNEAVLTFKRDGKWVTAVVPKYIAKMFDTQDGVTLGAIGDVMQSKVMRHFHSVFVTYNLGFVIANTPRDLLRTMRDLPAYSRKVAKEEEVRLISQGMPESQAKVEAAKKKISVFDVLRYSILGSRKTRSAAWLKARGGWDNIQRQMIDEGAISMSFISGVSPEEQAELSWKERQGLRSGVDVLAAKKDAVGFLATLHRGLEKAYITKLLGGVKFAGEFTEATGKIGPWRLMQDKGWSVENRVEATRRFAGTPDYLTKGHYTSFTNSIWMYSKIRLNALVSEVELAKDVDTRGAWWGHYLATGGMLTVLEFLIFNGLVDEMWPDLAEKMKKIPDYFYWNYTVIPLWNEPDGKVRFISIPKDETAASMDRIMWSILNGLKEHDEGALNEVASSFTEMLSPYTFNPAIDLAYKWGQYAVGKNPYDTFRGHNVVGDVAWQAGGWPRVAPMIDYSVGKTGAIDGFIRPVSEWITGDVEEKLSETETLIHATGLKRFWRKTDRGLTMHEWDEVAELDQERARNTTALPGNVRTTTAELFRLRKRYAGGIKLTPDELKRKAVLNRWYSKAYLPYTKAANFASQQGRGEDADIFREKLGEVTSRIRKLL